MHGVLSCAIALAVLVANGGSDWDRLNDAAREQARVPVRAGVPGERPFWNAHSKAFIHPPAFDFKETAEAKEYRFTLGDRSWVAAKPWLPVPADVWDSLKPGYYTLSVTCEAARGAPQTFPPRLAADCYPTKILS